jgi:16S rRNA (uracil1498-N3)-methyltransferase
MRIPRIYLPVPLARHTSVELDERTRRHVVQVLRVKVGEPLIIFNGQGGEYEATLSRVDKRCASVQTGQFHDIDRESSLTTRLGLGISKGDRMDYALQKAVELGVSLITPLFTEHCVVQLNASRQQKKLAHWQAVVTSACEQCGRNILPPVHIPLAFESWLATTGGDRLILDPGSTQYLADTELAGNGITLCIGPEGGFSQAELNQACAAGFSPVSLGPRVLRTETAAIGALAVIQSRWGDLG